MIATVNYYEHPETKVKTLLICDHSGLEDPLQQYVGENYECDEIVLMINGRRTTIKAEGLPEHVMIPRLVPDKEPEYGFKVKKKGG